ncbi:hypothetical protein H4R34_003956 [Dimargaris verticillata]|uniref:CCD97-like C-terminal domain-containing protein n=1 Tax=Dimargaris verticillata TaxID=2761393 RepID=A0A9W8AZV7_9FUNG|nr:hypothetical protein H4R34_003956 [Dimargaris verticillata]
MPSSPPGQATQASQQRGARDRSATVRNRRWYYLVHHLRRSGYFSDAALQRRDPVLYHQYKGRYQTAAEQATPFAPGTSLVDRMYHDIDQQTAHTAVTQHQQAQAQLLALLAAAESSTTAPPVARPGPDDDTYQETEDDGDSNENPPSAHCSNRPPVVASDEEGEEELPTAGREIMAQDLVALFEQRFLAGQELEFDYSQVDHNPAYDDVALQERDYEDAYFDSEEPN